MKLGGPLTRLHTESSIGDEYLGGNEISRVFHKYDVSRREEEVNDGVQCLSGASSSNQVISAIWKRREIMAIHGRRKQICSGGAYKEISHFKDTPY
jgi:hypothetical protein